MPQSKIKEFHPYLVGGTQKTWVGGPNKDKTFYEFNIIMEDGKTGIASSISTSPSWEIGIDYTYEHRSGGSYADKISKLKKVGGFTPGKSDFNNPQQTEQTAHRIAQRAAQNIYIHFDKKDFVRGDLLSLAGILKQWILKEGYQTRHWPQLRWFTVLDAVEGLKLFPDKLIVDIRDSKDFNEAVSKAVIGYCNVLIEDVNDKCSK